MSAAVTPFGQRLGDDTVIELLNGFEPEVLLMIVNLLAPGSEVLKAGIDMLFATRWHAME